MQMCECEITKVFLVICENIAYIFSFENEDFANNYHFAWHYIYGERRKNNKI